jgi:hypothetical protein
MLGIGDNFDYQGKKPNFARDCFSTLEKMKSYPETSIDPGHISFCGEDGKLYQYLPENEVNEVTGKWRRLVDSILDANSENPVQNKVVVKRCEDLEKLIAGSAEKVKGDIDLDIETMGGIIAAGMVDLNRNMDELEEAVSEALNSLNAGHVSLEEIKVNGHPITSSVNLNSTDIGLGNVDNTRDLDKPISTRVSAALNEKVDKSIRVNNKSLAQDVVIEKSDIGLGRVDNTGDMEKPVSNAVQQALDDKVSKVPGKDLVEDADIAKLKQLRTREELDELVKTVLQTLKTVGETHTARKDNPHNVTKDQVGLGSVDDTSDLDKPISRAVQEELGKKVDKEILNSEVIPKLNQLSTKQEELEKTLGLISPMVDTLRDTIIEMNSYGVEVDFSRPQLKYKELGNPELHKSLPIQNKIKPCILNDEGKVVKYLPIESGWSSTDVDGRLGQVMVEIPEFWYKIENLKNKLTVRLSEAKLPGFRKRRKAYIGAYNADLDPNNPYNEHSNNNHIRSGICSACVPYEYGEGENKNNPDVTLQPTKGKAIYSDDIYYNCDINKLLDRETGWCSLDYISYLSNFMLYFVEFKEVNLVDALNTEGIVEDVITVSDRYMADDETPEMPKSPKYIGETNELGGRSGIKVRKYGEKTCISNRYRGMENLVGEVSYLPRGVNMAVNLSDDRGNIVVDGFGKIPFLYVDPSVAVSTVKNLSCGIITTPYELQKTGDNQSTTTYLRACWGDYFLRKYYSGRWEVSGPQLLFGGFAKYVKRGMHGEFLGYKSSFTYFKPNYLSQGICDNFWKGVGTRLCYYPPEEL